MRKLLLSILGGFAFLAALMFYVLFFSPRPPLTTDPATLAGDGSTINYCEEIPELDGSGLMAADIPKGNTPGCAWSHFPLPILAQCTEPLAEGVVDIRGLWEGVEGEHIGYVERVEQCGRRMVVTAEGIIHDYGPNSTAGELTNDTDGFTYFTIGDKPYCMRQSADMIWNDEGVLDFHVLGMGPPLVHRYLDGDQLVWQWRDGTVTRMKRICKIPPHKIIPEPR